MEQEVSDMLERSLYSETFPFDQQINSIFSINKKNLKALQSHETEIINNLSLIGIKDPGKEVSISLTDQGAAQKIQNNVEHVISQNSTLSQKLKECGKACSGVEDNLKTLSNELDETKQKKKAARKEHKNLQSAFKAVKDRYSKVLDFNIEIRNDNPNDLIINFNKDKKLSIQLSGNELRGIDFNFIPTDKQKTILMDKSSNSVDILSLMCLYRKMALDM